MSVQALLFSLLSASDPGKTLTLCGVSVQGGSGITLDQGILLDYTVSGWGKTFWSSYLTETFKSSSYNKG